MKTRVSFCQKNFKALLGHFCKTLATLSVASLVVASPFSQALAGEQAIDKVIRNVDVTHCEAFIERAALVFGNGQHMSARFYIKLYPERLDGKVTYVGFHSYKSDEAGVCRGPSTLTNPACQNVGIWADYKSRPFVYESDDYHDLRIDLADVEGDAFAYEGVFFVQTDIGTRYWIHANQNSNNFYLNEKFVDAMIENSSAFNMENFDLSKVPPASALQIGLNSMGCY